MMRKTFLTCIMFLALAAVACNLPGSSVETPTALPVQPTDVPPATLEPTPTPPADLPTVTLESPPELIPDASVEAPPTEPARYIVYYYFASIPGNTFPAGSVEILPDQLILSPNLSEVGFNTDPVTNVYSGLTVMISDPRNVWTTDNLSVQLNNMEFDQGHMIVPLEGDIYGTGDIVLIAARWQILMSVFAADEAVQSATVTLNGESIGNLGTSHDGEAKPADYVYTREEVQTFMAENAYP